MRFTFGRRRGGDRELGQAGEELAANFLAREGYRILQRNYRCPAGEIDIIAELHDTIRFVEVKTRSSSGLFAPEDAVDRAKRAHIRAAARHYLAGYRDPSPAAFDVVSIVLLADGRVELIELHRDAFGWEEG